MTAEWDEMVLVGRIARAHGNRGRVIVDPATDFPEERFRPGAVVYIRRHQDQGVAAIEAISVVDVRFHRGRPILAFCGVETMDAAEALAGTELRIEASALQALPENAFYHHDLIDCRVTTPDGQLVGRVARVDGDAAGSRLVVEGSAGEVLIPLVADICIEIDTIRRCIVIDPPDGLIDLNVTRSRHRAL